MLEVDPDPEMDLDPGVDSDPGVDPDPCDSNSGSSWCDSGSGFGSTKKWNHNTPNLYSKSGLRFALAQSITNLAYYSNPAVFWKKPLQVNITMLWVQQIWDHFYYTNGGAFE